MIATVLVRPARGDPYNLFAPGAPASWRVTPTKWVHGWVCGPPEKNGVPVTWMQSYSADMDWIDLEDLHLRLVQEALPVTEGCDRAWARQRCAAEPWSQGAQARLHGWSTEVAKQLASVCALQQSGRVVYLDVDGNAVQPEE